MTIKVLAATAAILTGGLTLTTAMPARAADYVLTEIMSGLVTPRGLALGPGGALYVTEAGNGANGTNGPSVLMGTGNVGYLGSSSGLSRWQGGVQTRVLSGLPSLATATGADAGGLQDITFDASGRAYGLFGLGSSPVQRNNNLGPAGAELGTIVQLSLDGSGTRTRIADVTQHETTNPDGSVIDSNPFGFALAGNGGFVVADAGGNDFVRASAAGLVSTLAVLPARPNPLGFGPPFYQAVPTAITVGPDNAYYMGELTGFPFPPGAANVYRFDPATAALTVAYSGFTNIIDLAFDNEGKLLVLQVSSNGLASSQGPGSGLLLQIDPTNGTRTTIASTGLVFPGAVAVGPDGTIYVTNRTNSPLGQVLSISAVPEPATWLSWIGGLAAVTSGALRKRRAAEGGRLA